MEFNATKHCNAIAYRGRLNWTRTPPSVTERWTRIEDLCRTLRGRKTDCGWVPHAAVRGRGQAAGSWSRYDGLYQRRRCTNTVGYLLFFCDNHFVMLSGIWWRMGREWGVIYTILHDSPKSLWLMHGQDWQMPNELFNKCARFCRRVAFVATIAVGLVFSKNKTRKGLQENLLI